MGGKNLHCSNHMSNSMLISIFGWSSQHFPMASYDFSYGWSIFSVPILDERPKIPRTSSTSHPRHPICRFQADASLGHGAALPAPEERGGCVRGLDRLLEGEQTRFYLLVMTNIAIEHGDRNSGFTH